MLITSFTIDGNEVTPLLNSLDINESVGSVSTLKCGITSSGSPVMRYGVFSEVIVQEDGVKIFSGTITEAREEGFGGPILDGSGNPQIVTTIIAQCYNKLADRVSATETVVAGTLLKTFLTTLVTTYLSPLGVTLDAAQVNGPALPAMSFDTSLITEVLNALADATGYLWRIDYDKKLRMWFPGDLVAPFDIDQADSPPKWFGDVAVETILGDQYANRVIVIGNPINAVGHTETFTGDGVANSVTLEYTLTKHYGYVTYDGIFQTLRTPDDPDAASWTYDPADNSLTRTAGPIESGKILSITFDGTFSPRAMAEDAGEIAAHGLYEHIEHRSDITTAASAQDIADALLAQLLLAAEQTLEYSTRWDANTLRSGQSQNIVAPARNVSGDFIVRDLRIFFEVNPKVSGGWVTRTIVGKKQQVLAGKWQQTLHDWLGAGGGRGGGGSTTVVGEAGPASSGPALPNGSVQFNRDGSFGGDDGFTYDVTSRTVKVGIGHTPAGDSNVLIGTGHTVL